MLRNGSLFKVSCGPKINQTMEKVGTYVGMAFQIKDDIFDYGFSDNIGKPTGIDIKKENLPCH